ncbi:SET domain-containing protein [Cryptosporidium canis]|uniref:SET domain-containing protein n=1 Tax=Cryptosporidium canis TaxID=195482 RepID=A0A9D5DFQ5_9CRYT|nr:SET domain-containing protein [Cryptosporidium canis]
MMRQVVDSDDWLSSELQMIYSDTRGVRTRSGLSRALLDFEARLSGMRRLDYVSPRITLSRAEDSRSWQAQASISKGELLLAEIPVCWALQAMGDPIKDYSFVLWKELIRICVMNKRVLRGVGRLFPRTQADIGRCIQESKSCKIPVREIRDFFEGSPVLSRRIGIREGIRLYLVVKFNQMSINMLPELWKNPLEWSERFLVSSLYLKSSFFDHSCIPNVARFYIGTVAVFRALRPIQPNETLSICYIESEYIQDPLWIRSSELNFFCRCQKCQREGGFSSDDQHSRISEINRASRRLNKRCSLLTARHISILQGLPIRERISVVNEILTESFIDDDKVRQPSRPKLVGLDASKLIGFLAHDYISIKDFDKAKFWLNFLRDIIKIRDEHHIPILLLLGMISGRGPDQNRYFSKAVRISTTIFGNNIKKPPEREIPV